MGTRRRNQPKHLPYKLGQIRAKLDVGQKEMARLLQKVEPSVQAGMVSRYERGLLEPSLIVLREYARLGRTTMEVLVDDRAKLPKRLLRN
jgi:transcriptional regulator with XRE-family HTH domain